MAKMRNLTSVTSLASLRDALRDLKTQRVEKDRLGKLLTKSQPEILAALTAADPENVGVSVELANGSTVAAYRVNPEAGETWNMEKLVPYLRKVGALRSVQTTYIDPAKVEAEIKVGNLSSEDLEKFRVKGKPAASYIRFGDATADSITD